MNSHKISSNYLYPFKSYGGVPNFKFRSRDCDHAHFRGQFVMLWLEHVVLDECTNYKVFYLQPFQKYKGGTVFQNGSHDLSHAPLMVKFSSADKGFHEMC